MKMIMSTTTEQHVVHTSGRACDSVSHVGKLFSDMQVYSLTLVLSVITGTAGTRWQNRREANWISIYAPLVIAVLHCYAGVTTSTSSLLENRTLENRCKNKADDCHWM